MPTQTAVIPTVNPQTLSVDRRALAKLMESNHASVILKAISNNSMMILEYTDVKRVKTIRIVEPKELKMSNAGDITLISRDTGKNEIRAFRVDRIQQVKILEDF